MGSQSHSDAVLAVQNYWYVVGWMPQMYSSPLCCIAHGLVVSGLA